MILLFKFSSSNVVCMGGTLLAQTLTGGQNLLELSEVWFKRGIKCVKEVHIYFSYISGEFMLTCSQNFSLYLFCLSYGATTNNVLM